jgi:hypothetical protein
MNRIIKCNIILTLNVNRCQNTPLLLFSFHLANINFGILEEFFLIFSIQVVALFSIT